ncbi:YtkA-like [Salegentibacter echinorum]|uniref:YtkA-like n=1 Tax=Salegentibacter echinorum TaxID=1073325 RepID=A0A1M5CTT8_SALEC|nr:FixH family protein [Salegentibacter echinorum]SHF58139.1 YtkA-like [Salegentibacter echinorum]
MKTLHYIFTLLILSTVFIGCSSDDTEVLPDALEDLNKLYEFSEADHDIEIYSEKEKLQVGFNEIYIRFKKDDAYLSDVKPTWMPVMNMENMKHSAPHTKLNNTENPEIYKGNIVFQMPENETETWELILTYNLDGEHRENTYQISVKSASNDLKKVQVFQGKDGEKYVLAYVNPKNPKVATNDFQAALYKMESMMSFQPVKDFNIEVDPRMPGMDNHSSPNNKALTYNSATKLYEGKLSLTMTGYWRINLKMLNSEGNVIKGENVTKENPESSLYFELEF